MIEARTVYFPKPGPENTEEALRIARLRAEELGIKTIVVASTRGNTASMAVEILDGFRVIVVSHSTGFQEPNVQEFTGENREKRPAVGGEKSRPHQTPGQQAHKGSEQVFSFSVHCYALFGGRRLPGFLPLLGVESPRYATVGVAGGGQSDQLPVSLLRNAAFISTASATVGEHAFLQETVAPP